MKHLDPKEAHALLQSDSQALLIDVRSDIEYLFVGHPVGAIHVSWHDGPDWDINPHFVGEVRRLADDSNDRPILLLCRSGNRSEEAGEALETAGFTNVINIRHGFEGERDEQHHRNTLNGWRVDGLPWEQT